VLAVDRVSFPSDTISSHQLQVPGVALLQRWGLGQAGGGGHAADPPGAVDAAAAWSWTGGFRL
jgi:hypothetical protein